MVVENRRETGSRSSISGLGSKTNRILFLLCNHYLFNGRSWRSRTGNQLGSMGAQLEWMDDDDGDPLLGH